jgi:hypothetical protein
LASCVGDSGRVASSRRARFGLSGAESALSAITAPLSSLLSSAGGSTTARGELGTLVVVGVAAIVPIELDSVRRGNCGAGVVGAGRIGLAAAAAAVSEAARDTDAGCTLAGRALCAVGGVDVADAADDGVFTGVESRGVVGGDAVASG